MMSTGTSRFLAGTVLILTIAALGCSSSSGTPAPSADCSVMSDNFTTNTLSAGCWDVSTLNQDVVEVSEDTSAGTMTLSSISDGTEGIFKQLTGSFTTVSVIVSGIDAPENSGCGIALWDDASGSDAAGAAVLIGNIAGQSNLQILSCDEDGTCNSPTSLGVSTLTNNPVTISFTLDAGTLASASFESTAASGTLTLPSSVTVTTTPDALLGANNGATCVYKSFLVQ